MPLNPHLEYLLQKCLYLALLYTYKSNLHKVSKFKLKVDNWPFSGSETGWKPQETWYSKILIFTHHPVYQTIVNPQLVNPKLSIRWWIQKSLAWQLLTYHGCHQPCISSESIKCSLNLAQWFVSKQHYIFDLFARCLGPRLEPRWWRVWWGNAE